jgi:hypothetical protein
VNDAAFSPDGKRIVTASDDNSARLWDAATGKQIAALEDHSGKVWIGLHGAGFSPDGQRILTASVDSAHLWDAAAGQQIAAFEAHTGRVNSAAFSPDGQYVVTASQDGTARIRYVSRSAVMVGRRGLCSPLALARGVGQRTNREYGDLLMQEAPGDLYAGALTQLGRAADDPEITEIAAHLGAPLHPNCYLSPTQFAEKFGLAPPTRAAEETAPGGTAAAGASEGLPKDAGAGTPHVQKSEAPLPPSRRRLLRVALIVLQLTFALCAVALALLR